MTLALSLASCGKKEKEIKQNGIEISPDKEYSVEILAYAEEKIYSVLETVLLNEMPALTDKKREELKKISAEVTEITAREPISEKKYKRLLELIATDGSELITSLGKDDAYISGIEDLYLGVSSIIGADRAGALVYDLTLYGYAYKRDVAYERYNTYKYTHLLVEAERLAYDFETVEREIGRDNFVGFMKLAFAAAELAVGGASSEELSSFSDEEILAFLGYSDVLGIEIGERGWNFLLALGGGLIGDEASSVASLLSEPEYTEKTARVMTSVMSLISLMSDRLDRDDISLIREGNGGEVLASLLSEFNDDDWLLFERETDIDFDTEEMDIDATEDYGEDYLVYKSEIKKMSVEELRALLKKENSYESVRAYFEGLCPAVLYGMKK
jgi:hypothetical protein